MAKRGSRNRHEIAASLDAHNGQANGAAGIGQCVDGQANGANGTIDCHAVNGNGKRQWTATKVSAAAQRRADLVSAAASAEEVREQISRGKSELDAIRIAAGTIVIQHGRYR